MSVKNIMPKISDFLITALYYFLVWSACMAFINKVLGLW